MTGGSEIANALKARFNDIEGSEFRGQNRVVVQRGHFLEVMTFLKKKLQFDLLVDVTCVDYLNYRGALARFGMVYILASSEIPERLTVRVILDESDINIESVTPLWEGANWMEREVWDMFGVRFAGHPDLRRILLPDEFNSHPLRKDYPLQGRGERHNFPVLTRNQA